MSTHSPNRPGPEIRQDQNLRVISQMRSAETLLRDILAGSGVTRRPRRYWRQSRASRKSGSQPTISLDFGTSTVNCRASVWARLGFLTWSRATCRREGLALQPAVSSSSFLLGDGEGGCKHPRCHLHRVRGGLCIPSNCCWAGTMLGRALLRFSLRQLLLVTLARRIRHDPCPKHGCVLAINPFSGGRADIIHSRFCLRRVFHLVINLTCSKAIPHLPRTLFATTARA